MPEPMPSCLMSLSTIFHLLQKTIKKALTTALSLRRKRLAMPISCCANTSTSLTGALSQPLTMSFLVPLSARKTTLFYLVKRQEDISNAVYQRELKRVKHALEVAEKQGIERARTDVPAGQLPSSELFMLGKPALEAQYEALQATGPGFDADYDHNRAILSSLEEGVKLDSDFRTYRYLRTPEDPIARDKPRRLFLLIMWGGIGGLIGAGVALTRRRRA